MPEATLQNLVTGRGEEPPIDEAMQVLRTWKDVPKEDLLLAFEGGNFAGIEEMKRNDRLFERVAPMAVNDIMMAVQYKWAQMLPASVQVCPVEIPGRGRREGEPALDKVHDLARRGEEPPIDEAMQVLRTWKDVPKEDLLLAFEGGNFAGIEEMKRNDRLFERVAPMAVNDIMMAVQYK
ncbi:Erythronolide modules 3 and 4 [Chlorella sorokiniana]|uniref:Erythronolide modules 3 and 4 n=1 Tax=Chlorella sorokiniana TaxID=3076 RepID=A0A2P6TD99_CHLSO|nr:Erythronolide modules 3 and 4 [Chlorella sorokiniana]|eukprot:PRW20616.1 Erythronolide modules 3 and 4 [Chlorella sorokiniana]